MNPESLPFFICPACGASLQASASNGAPIADGTITCGGCSAVYPVVRGIPRFVPKKNYADSFGFQWNIHRKTQIDSYTGLSISRDRVFGVTGWPENMEGETILEAGSGAGRFTEILASTGATLFTFDLSSAVDANGANNGNNKNVTFFQASIYDIPLRKESFDRVFCLGVIQHTPDPERSFKNLVSYVKPGGRIAIDVYDTRISAYFHWRPILRPITKRMNKERLYRIISAAVPVLLPVSIFLRKVAGRIGVRLLPIAEYSNLGLDYELNKQWSILDTFDIFSPAHDHPQSINTVRRWFEEAGLTDINVRFGPNGVVATGLKSVSAD